ncbi:MAG: sensor histidine kinase [Actinobacteria bacterium]|nr:sensor histidine kinase [Actinomycetota bacterium]
MGWTGARRVRHQLRHRRHSGLQRSCARRPAHRAGAAHRPRRRDAHPEGVVLATLIELAKQHTDAKPDDIDHLQRLVGSWGMLADLCFADLLLFAAEADANTERFVVLGQVRPSTSQTLHRDDLVGRVIEESERPLVARAWRLGEIVEGELTIPGHGERARLQCIPVKRSGRMVAVVTRESPLTVGRRPGELERVYVETFDRFARMLLTGDFPFLLDDVETEESPRVGDGVLLLDGGGRVDYASPNAVNALHRMGIYSGTEGSTFDELGIDDTPVKAAFASRSPVTEEVERRADVTVLMRCVPLLDNGGVTGGLVLLRDVTELRRRDRLLLSKDASIREVHHRVKNNLQTTSSLLRLQARRLPPGEGRTALGEAERRIRTIALVHEVLSRDPVEQVPFTDIVKPLVRMAEDGASSLGRAVVFRVEGDPGELRPEVATSLALVLNELLQNAAEHAFPEEAEGDGLVVLAMHNDGSRLSVRVVDNGVGLPDDFSIDRTNSLGLSIVREMVQTQLSGSIEMLANEAGGTLVELDIPLAET